MKLLIHHLNLHYQVLLCYILQIFFSSMHISEEHSSSVSYVSLYTLPQYIYDFLWPKYVLSQYTIVFSSLQTQ